MGGNPGEDYVLGIISILLCVGFLYSFYDSMFVFSIWVLYSVGYTGRIRIDDVVLNIICMY